MGEIILLLISWVSLLLSIGMILTGDWNKAIYFALVAIFLWFVLSSTERRLDD